MAKLNKPKTRSTNVLRTHEDAPAKRINPEQMLRRSVMSSLLWESEFYEDGISISERVADLIPRVNPKAVSDIAIEAREQMKLRHMPLFITREMARHNSHKSLVANTLATVIQRADELAEFVAMYWKDGKQPLSAQVKLGLASAFTKFDAYQLAKYNREGSVALRDVLFLCHAKPISSEQDALWKKLIDGTLEPPDTWEVALTQGKDKKETFERLVTENKLGALALLRNLRNMVESGIGETLITNAITNVNTKRILPFRFIAAARYTPQFENHLEQALFRCLQDKDKLSGRTIVLVDVSGSMDVPLSSKSDMKRDDAGYGLAMIARELCEDAVVFTFSNDLCRIAPRHGFALRDAMRNSQDHAGTFLGAAINKINKELAYERIIVITDEQAHDVVPNPVGRGFMINVASYENGVGYGKWTHIDGWSEAIFDYIAKYEDFAKKSPL